MIKRNLLVIYGPTATGKTKLGLDLARQFKGEIISGDSRQVYQGMDIGTGKDLPINSKLTCSRPPALGEPKAKPEQLKTQNLEVGYHLINKIPVWLYDLVRPDYRFNVADYVRCAERVIKYLWQQEKLPILVGGTGFYIKALIDGVETLAIRPNWRLRRRLDSLSSQELFEILARFDSHKAASLNISDRQNPRRLIRAIEVAQKKQPRKAKERKTAIEKILIIGLKAPNSFIYQRIDHRVRERVNQGLEKEIRALLKKGYRWENSVLSQTLGYREWRPFFKGQASPAEVVERWQFHEHAYARRQLNWFKKDRRANWFDISQEGWQKKVIRRVSDWLSD